MATRDFKWRVAPSANTEGTTTVYVDSNFGSDVWGAGTRANPYQTLRRAWTARTTKPSIIICRGIFSELMSDGNHSATIRGDYFGAAVFDGQGKYMLYGFTHNNLIIRNVPTARGDEPVQTGSLFLAGVGRAYIATSVGAANNVAGVAGSFVSLHGCSVYMGTIGGSTAVKNVVYDTILQNGAYPLRLAGQQNAVFLSDCTVYGADVNDRAKGTSGNSVENTIFADFAMIGNEGVKRTYTRCVFAGDVKWYWFSGATATSGYEELVLTGATSDERRASLLALLTEKGLASNLMPSFSGCVFSTQTAAQLFNDPAKGDFTLKPGCDADWLTSANTYCGALPPSLHIPVMTDSTGHAETWDERSASGCLRVDDNAIVLDTDSDSLAGEVLSKIIVVDPAKVQLDSIWCEYASQIPAYRMVANKDGFVGTRYTSSDELPVGRYIVNGGRVQYAGEEVADGGVVVVSETGTTFTVQGGTPELVEVVEPNATDVVYCRCRAVVYARATPSDDLQRGATYLNDGEESIVYHNRTIAPGESFVCMIAGERFTAPDHVGDTPYSVAIMFDDTRVPTSEWIPAQLMGEYFVSKFGGSIETDTYGVPYSSGNYMSYQGKTLLKSVLDRRYIQFALKVQRYGNSSIGE